MILVISHSADEHAVEVLNVLHRVGHKTLLLDTSQFPQEMQLATEQLPGSHDGKTSMRIDGQWHDLREVKAAWWRRPLPYALHDQMTGDDRAFAFGECQAAITGLWSCLDARWMNDPERDEVASRKLWQLSVAKKVGLRVPHTLVTNDPASARSFIEGQGEAGTIYKAFSATERSWRETRLIRTDELPLLEAVGYAPVIFQEYVRAPMDLRITVVGEEIYAAEIMSAHTDYPMDYRMTMHQTTIASHTLPPSVAQSLLALMKAMGLIYGAIDMRRTEAGEYVFLEINPAGQWLFMEQRTDLPITAAVAAQLQRMDS